MDSTVPRESNLAVTHRPTRMAEVAGQHAAVRVLRAAAATSRPPAQLLLAGSSGTGKTTIGRLFAAACFCPHPPDLGDNCGQCPECRDVADGTHPDVIEIDAASHGGVDQIRDLASTAMLAPMRARWRVYIIDEAHGLTGAGASAFLKLLEEPPAATIWILATTDPGKLPIALRSRCLAIPMATPTLDEQVANLRRITDAEGWSFSDTVLRTVITSSDPALGVRGTVTTLAALALYTSATGTIDDDAAAAALAGATAEQIETWFALVDSGDTPGAARHTLAVLTTASPAVFAGQLASEALRRVTGAGASADAGRPLHTWTHLGAAAPGTTGLLLATCNAADAAASTAGTTAAQRTVCAAAENGTPPAAPPSPVTAAAVSPADTNTTPGTRTRRPDSKRKQPEAGSQMQSATSHSPATPVAGQPEAGAPGPERKKTAASRTQQSTSTDTGPAPIPGGGDRRAVTEETVADIPIATVNSLAARNTKAALLARRSALVTTATGVTLRTPPDTDKYLAAALAGLLRELGTPVSVEHAPVH